MNINKLANIIQYIEYLPYGELFFERRDYWNTPYKFNAKELDEETGMYYYGARYYTPEVSIWLSVDRFADKCPHLSPYHYCLNNPIMLTDVNGDTVRYSNGAEKFVKEAMLNDPEFAARIEELDKSDVIYNFNYLGVVTDDDEGKAGEVWTDGNEIMVDFSSIESDYYGEFSNLYHEAEHATQFEYGEYGFFMKDGKWIPDENFDLSEEVKARNYSMKAPGTKSYVKDGWESKSVQKKMNFLKRFSYRGLYETTVKNNSYGQNNISNNNKKTIRLANEKNGRFFKTYTKR
jgi:RHS repeat-associated protein